MDNPDQVDFEWGKKRRRGGVKGDVQFYESFRYDGVEYCLYDSVYLFTENEATPYVGKLLKIWELASKVKKVKVIWFFRPKEVSRYLGNLEAHPKEIFLACGSGNGLTNVNPLEVIAGKCSVICTSADERNRKPSPEEVNMADHIFSRTFDVEKLTFSDNLGVKIADVDVRFFFNKSVPESFCTPKTNNNHEPDYREVVNSMDKLVSPKSAALDKVDSGATLDVFAGKAVKALKASLGIKEKSPGSETPSKSAGLGTAEAKTRSDFARNLVEAVDTTLRLAEQEDAVDTDEGNNNNILRTGVAETFSSIDDHDCCSSKKDGSSSTTSDHKGSYFASLLSDKRESDLAQDSQKHIKQSVKRKYVDGTSIIDTCGPKKIRAGDQQLNTTQNLVVDVDPAKVKPSKFTVPTAEKKLKGILSKNPSDASLGPSKMIKNEDKMTCLQADKLWTSSHNKMSEKRSKVYGQVVDVTRRPDVDRSKWFINLVWKDRVKAANTDGRLVMLQNLDPTYSSSDVEDIVWHGFKENCSAKVIPYETAVNPPRGDALIIMKSKEAAERVVRELQEGCMLLPNGRPLMGTIGVLHFPGQQTTFLGHLVIARIKLQQQKENSLAVSTSHSAQSNTLEYDMAMEWRLFQDRSDSLYKKLFKQQREELKEQKEKLMVKGR